MRWTKELFINNDRALYACYWDHDMHGLGFERESQLGLLRSAMQLSRNMVREAVVGRECSIRIVGCQTHVPRLPEEL